MINKQQALDMLAMLDGDPPYDIDSNICRNDRYFALSIEQKFGIPLTELRKILERE